MTTLEDQVLRCADDWVWANLIYYSALDFPPEFRLRFAMDHVQASQYLRRQMTRQLCGLHADCPPADMTADLQGGQTIYLLACSDYTQIPSIVGRPHRFSIGSRLCRSSDVTSSALQLVVQEVVQSFPYLIV